MVELLISKIISSIIQNFVFLIIPFICWLIRGRFQEGFASWIGLKNIENAKENKTVLWIIGITVLFSILSVFMLYTLKGIEMATSEFAGLKAAAIPAILIYAIFNTALPEEIVFRGFILKAFSKKIGFWERNIFQGLIFGIIHGVMFFAFVGAVKAVIIICFTGMIGVLMGVVDEKKAGGSIIPSWCIHAFANILSGMFAAYSIFG